MRRSDDGAAVAHLEALVEWFLPGRPSILEPGLDEVYVCALCFQREDCAEDCVWLAAVNHLKARRGDIS